MVRASSARWFGSNVQCKSSKRLFPGVTDTHVTLVPYSTADHRCTSTITAALEDQEAKVGWFGVCTQATPALSYPGKLLLLGVCALYVYVNI